MLWAFAPGLLGLLALARQDAGPDAAPPAAAPAAEEHANAAPARRPEEELATFRVPAGFQVELVAAEPLVRDPVVAVWDGDGRLWVCEMRGYMRDAAGAGESDPIGAIAVLTDKDGDGRMDERRVFLDGLVLPRAILPIRGGLLYIEPPRLIFARDDDGDGRGDGPGDTRLVLETNLGGIESPEHAINGLLVGIDGWIQCANHNARLRFRPDGSFERQPIPQAGQWGIAKDDLGRIYFNTSTDPLRGDPYSSHYAVRNPHQGVASGVNVDYAPEKGVWPARATPVNRGDRAGILRADGTLASFTAACSPLIYRGDALLPELSGQAFVCEPAANLIKRYRLEERGDGALIARNAVEGGEFLTSTDERFRPVHLFDGPDGALYIADMYRGVIQHRLFLSSYLQGEIEERGLAEPTGLGRIFRVVHEGRRGAGGPKLSSASAAELAALLGHPSGWWRDAAQRALVERGGAGDSDVPAAVARVLEQESPLARMHALWTLAQLGALSPQIALAALRDPHALVRHAAIRVSEPWLGGGEPEGAREPREHPREQPKVIDELIDELVALGTSGDAHLARQVLLSLGEGRSEATDVAILRVLDARMADPDMRSAAISGLAGRELELLRRIAGLSMWLVEAPGRADFLRELACCAVREGRFERVEHVLFLAATRPPTQEWQAAAMLRGVLDARPKGPDGAPGPLELAEEPVGFEKLAKVFGAEAGPLGREVAAILAWPGRDVPVPTVAPLTEDEGARFARGRDLYAAACAQCHQESGAGEPGKAPRLLFSPYVLGDPAKLVRIVRFGLAGPIDVDGVRWNAEMPAWSSSDEDLAALLTYLRRAWGHGASPVDAASAGAASAAVGARSAPFTAPELEQAGR